MAVRPSEWPRSTVFPSNKNVGILFFSLREAARHLAQAFPPPSSSFFFILLLLIITVQSSHHFLQLGRRFRVSHQTLLYTTVRVPSTFSHYGPAGHHHMPPPIAYWMIHKSLLLRLEWDWKSFFNCRDGRVSRAIAATDWVTEPLRKDFPLGRMTTR
jgi:hypothetical protein